MTAAVRYAAVLGAVLWAAPVLADPVALSAMNHSTNAALGGGDLPRALIFAEVAVRRVDSAPVGEPAAEVEALNTLGYLLLRQGGVDGRAGVLLNRALVLADGAGLTGSLVGLLTLQNAASLAVRQGDATAAGLLGRFVAAGRTSAYHADVLGVAADLYFQLGQFQPMADALDEMVAVGGTVRSSTTLEEMYAAQGVAEQDGRIDDASALIDARITLVRAMQPELADRFAHAALWTKFYMNHEAGNLGVAADALRVWAATGQMTAEERAFIETQASNTLLYTQLAGYSTQRTVQLGNAQLAVAYAQVLQKPDDPRLGWALRALAQAQTALGQLEAAQSSLQEALAVLDASEAGAEGRYLVLADLAVNAWDRDDAALAQRLFAQSDAEYRAAVAGGMAELSRIDRAIGFQNRARLATDVGDGAEAEADLAQAWALFREDQAAQVQKSNVRALEVSLLITEAGVDDLAGRAGMR